MTEPETFGTAADLRVRLAGRGAEETELWVRVFRVGSGIASVGWTDCVVEAIAVGWIDARKQSLDATSWLQRLTPRRPGSNWSKRNRDHADRLVAEGRMTPEGMAHVDAARADGRWTAAYAGPAGMTIPDDFLAALEAEPEAKALFARLDRKNLYPIYYRLATARTPATRERRMRAMIAQLARGERFH